MIFLICGNEIPENEKECPTCTSFIDTLNFLAFSHFDEAKLPKPLKIPGLITHIQEILKMSYEDFRVNLDSLSKKGFELINLEKDTEVKNIARNFFQFFLDFMNSREVVAKKMKDLENKNKEKLSEIL